MSWGITYAILADSVTETVRLKFATADAKRDQMKAY